MKFIHLSFKDYAFPSPNCFLLIGALSSREFMPSTCPIASLHVGAVEASFLGLRNAGLPQRPNQRCWSWCWAKVGSCSATCDFGVPPVPDPWSCATKASTNGTELSRKEVDFNRGEEEKAMPSLQFSLARSCRRSMCWELWSWAIHSRSYDHGFFCGTCAWSILWQKKSRKEKEDSRK